MASNEVASLTLGPHEVTFEECDRFMEATWRCEPDGEGWVRARRLVIEAALAHVVQNKVEAAYARSDLFEQRRRLMNDWATYLGGSHKPDNPSRP